MSEPRLITAVALLALCAAVLPAQQDLASLEARRAALRVRADSLQQAVRRLQAAERDTGLVADAHAGSLRVRTTERLRRAAVEAATRTMADAHAVIGLEADTLAARLQLTLREESVTRDIPFFPLGGATFSRRLTRITHASLEATLDGKGGSAVSLSWPLRSADLSTSMLALLEGAAATMVPQPTERWLNHGLPLRTYPPEFWSNMYRQFATSGAAVLRRCVAGDRPACSRAFALDSVPQDRIAAWYDDSDLPGLARTLGDPIQRANSFRHLTRDDQAECTERGHMATCRQMLAALPIEAFGIPMSITARASLTRLALEVGGLAAASRLNAAGTATTVGQQLAAAAGIPADSLVRLWQQRVIAARPASPLPNASFVLASLACIAVCGTLAVRGQPWK